ncbi:MAG: Tab2/Atab2 family RNA-binding protein [Synechococcaceae cyanobacterium]|nr:Tab2/Atab2 family RNA-binding protein [Synechococcaceae cyanobacterium]
MSSPAASGSLRASAAAIPAAASGGSPDWELDFYSRPILEPDGKKRWELLISATPEPGAVADPFRWVRPCPAASVNSVWLREALELALLEAEQQGLGRPRRLRTWRPAMRTMVQRAAEGLGLELVPSRRCYALRDWLSEREASVYPAEPGYMAGPLAPPPEPLRSAPLPLPEVARGDRWSWATLPVAALAEAPGWPIDFAALFALPPLADPAATVPGIRLFSRGRALAIAGWLAGLEPVRLEVSGRQLVLEAGLEDRWLLSDLPAEEATAAAEALAASRRQAGGLQFLAVQGEESDARLQGFWMLRDLPDG